MKQSFISVIAVLMSTLFFFTSCNSNVRKNNDYDSEFDNLDGINDDYLNQIEQTSVQEIGFQNLNYNKWLSLPFNMIDDFSIEEEYFIWNGSYKTVMDVFEFDFSANVITESHISGDGNNSTGICMNPSSIHTDERNTFTINSNDYLDAGYYLYAIIERFTTGINKIPILIVEQNNYKCYWIPFEHVDFNNYTNRSPYPGKANYVTRTEIKMK